MALGPIPDLAAKLTLEGFDGLSAILYSVTRRAQRRFEDRDWEAGKQDAIERYDAYEVALTETSARLDRTLGPAVRDRSCWIEAKAHFARLVAHRYDVDRAETFFNSVTRVMLNTVGINRDAEFFHLHFKSPQHQLDDIVYRSYTHQGDTAKMVRRILEDFHFRVPYENSARDAELIAQEIDLHLWPVVGLHSTFSIDVVYSVFYRNQEAYIIGRIVADSRVMPLFIPLVNGDAGIRADTVLLHDSEASIVFSFAYAHFFVDVTRYDALIAFLRTILPHAGLAELHTALGYHRHGKTEFYRDLHRFVHVSKELFVVAPGIEGAVLIAFTLPNYQFVFKVIKDKPCFLRSLSQTSKSITNEEVRRKYDLVSHRDPAGRMVDTQEFENLRFRRKRFSEALLDEFIRGAVNAVLLTDEHVILRHAYVQSKVTPLPIFFDTERDPEAIRRVLIDFGYFLKDIAASGVFPSDLFNTWNYGVTNWGRVVLYDYDDVVPIEQVTFREKPVARNDDEEMAPAENWILATDDDFFMDEMDRFSGIPRPLKGFFKSVHGDLYTLQFWHQLTDRIRSGHVFEVVPYDRAKRFRNSVAASYSRDRN